MNVFYIKQDEFKKFYDKDFAKQYADKEFKTEKRFYEYTIGRYLVKKAAKEFYNLSDTEIILQNNGKPVLKNSNLCFNISHSKNIVSVCFDENPCGLDIEYIKERDLNRFSDYYKQNFETLDGFYKFWTFKEAAYKLDADVKDTYSCKFEMQYFLTVASVNKIENISLQKIL
ncbi:MAG: hypothetical protein K6C94_09115 [Candidatus Gastranaerophilales bacterium]|nr:hypothetical protein [Candidatus Gastranaerophilales bacterium]